MNAQRFSIFPLALFAVTAFTGCDHKQKRHPAPLVAEQIIRQCADTPISQSIQKVALSMVGKSFFVPTDAAATGQPSNVVLRTLRFKVAEDNQGRSWAYAYTSKYEFSQAFPKGGPLRVKICRLLQGD